MKQLSRRLPLLLPLLLSVLLALAGCAATQNKYDALNEGNKSYTTDPAVHTFEEEEWSTDNITHWHEDECFSHHQLFYIYKDRAPHTLGPDNACTVCGYRNMVTGGLAFELLADGTYAVTGLGTAQWFENVEKWKDSYAEYEVYYTSNSPEKYPSLLRIPPYHDGLPVTKIAAGAFKDAEAFGAVIIPHTVKEIGEGAFFGGEYLSELRVEAGSALTVIGEEAFSRCAAMHTADLQNAGELSVISPRAFLGCSGLGRIHFPAGVTAVGEDAFLEANAYASVYAPSFADWCKIDFANKEANPAVGRSIYFGALAETGLPMEFPREVTKIGSYALYGANYGWRHLEITKDCALAEIGTYAFGENTVVKELSLPSGVRVADTAFSACHIEKAAVPAELLPALRNADCESLKTLTVTDGDEIEGLSCFKNLEAVSLSSPISRIGDGTFAGCVHLKTVELPATLTEIGKRAFADCTAMASPVFPATALRIESEAFLGCSSYSYLKLPTTTAEVAETAFSGCPLYAADIPAEFLSHVNLPTLCELNIIAGSRAALPTDTIEAYGGPRWTRLMNVTLADTVTSIGPSLFRGCTEIINFKMSRMINEIGEAAFRGCQIANCTKEGRGRYLGIEGNDYFIFIGLDSPNTVTSFTLHDDTRYVAGFAFEGTASLSEVTLNEDLLYVGEDAFSGCTALSKVTFGEPTRWYAEPLTTPAVYLDLSNTAANATTFKSGNSPIRHTFS